MIIDMLKQQLGNSSIRQMSQVLGTDETATGSAAPMALPLLVGARCLVSQLSSERGGSISADIAVPGAGLLLFGKKP